VHVATFHSTTKTDRHRTKALSTTIASHPSSPDISEVIIEIEVNRIKDGINTNHNKLF